MLNWLLRLFGLDLTDEEREFLKNVDAKQKRLAKHGGRIVVTDRGAIYDQFDTEEGRVAYEKEVRARTGIKSIQ